MNENVQELATLRTAFGGFGDYVKSSIMSVTNLPLATEAIASVKSLVGVLGLVPAVAGAAGLAVGTLKIAFSGFGQAMKDIRDPKKFAEAIKEMPKPMQDTAKSVRSFLPQWDALKRSVQISLFQGLAAQVKGLGQTYLPVLERSAISVAKSFNRASVDMSMFLRDPGTMGDISFSMANMAKFTDGFARSLKPAVQIFVDFVKVGSEFLPGMGNGMATAAEKAAAFVREARQTGKLKAWIQEGIDTLKAFVATIINVGQILSGVLRAANVNGQGFAETLRVVTERIQAWVNSAEGQEKIRQVFDGLRNVAFALLAILGPLSTVVFAIAGAFAKLSPEMQQNIGMMVGWGGLVVLLGSKLLMLGTVLKGLFGMVKTFGSALSWLGPKLLLLGRTLLYAGINATYMAARFALASVKVILSLARMALVGTAHVIRMAAVTVAQFAWMTATALYHVAIMWARTVAYFAINSAVVIGKMVATAAVVVAQWAMMAAGAMARAAIMAAAWFVALGPIGWAIAAVVGLVALIIANWETVKRWTIAAWNAVSGAVSAAWGWVTRAVSDGVGSVVGFVAGLPGRILGALGNLGNLLWNAGVSLVSGFWNGIVSRWNQMVSWVKQGMANLRALWPFSPAKTGPFSGRGYVSYSGAALTKDFAASLRAGIPDVLTAARGVMSAASMDMSSANVPTPRGLAAASAGRSDPIRLESDGSALMDAVVKIVREAIRKQGGNPGVIGG